MSFFVNGTVRQEACKKGSPITKLVLDREHIGVKVYEISRLKGLADVGLLWSKCRKTGMVARVRIFWCTTYRRWIATTNRDATTCDNLLSKPIFQSAGSGFFETVRECPI